MVKGKSKPELYILFMLGLKPKEIKKHLPNYSLSTIYYYFKRFVSAKEFLIKKDVIDANLKLKIGEGVEKK